MCRAGLSGSASHKRRPSVYKGTTSASRRARQNGGARMRWTCGMLATICAWVLSGAGPVAQKPPLKNPYEGNADAIRNGMGYYRSRCADLPRNRCAWRSRAGPHAGLGLRPHRRRPLQHRPARRARHRDARFRTATQPGRRHLAGARVSAHAFGARANQSAARQRREQAEKIFRASCAGCHRVDGAGGRLGPDLSRVGVARSRDTIVARIRRGLEESGAGYEPVTLTPPEGPQIRA